ncbi:MAG: SUMF1/EgtB/PvdO family nonheme iron enzyme [Polyangiales bacterium]
MTVDLPLIHRWIWDETVTLPDPETVLDAASALIERRSLDTAASLLDRAWGAKPTHRALQDARARLLDQLSVTEHSIHFRYIPAGWYRQGSEDGDEDEQPRRRVELDAFWIAEEPLTWTQVAALADLTPPPELQAKSDPPLDQDQFDRDRLVGFFNRRIIEIYCTVATDTPPSEMNRAQPRRWVERTADAYAVLPAVGFNHETALRFVKARAEGLFEYDLPTEAQWERAARGGLPDARYPWGDTEPSPRLADFDRFEQFSIRPVRETPPNGYGLFGVAGGVREWCADWYDALEYQQIASRNPTGPSTGVQRVARGGSWADCAAALRVSFRSAFTSGPYWNDPSVGLRPIRRVRRA